MCNSKMAAGNLISSLLSLGASLLPSIRASPSSSTNNSDSQEQLHMLMRTVERIKVTLSDAEERDIRDSSVKLWLNELKRVAYDADDVLSEYRYKATRVKVEAIRASEASGIHKRKQMECTVPVSDDMVDRLKKIRSRFDEIAKDHEALQLRESDGVRHSNNTTLRATTGHMVDESSVFGREDDVRKVVNLLLLNEDNFSVISIIGKGGLGKTTIAQLVFKDQNVQQAFDSFTWVCVSDDFNINKIIRATIESLTKEDCGLSELSPLQEKLANEVKGKRMLLVLDDVWNENQNPWESFWIPLKEAKLVKILVTTRNDKVAEVMQTTAYIRPTYLSEDSCQQLFQYYAFFGNIVPTSFVEMGTNIMRKCGGLPLAVKSIASLLRHETNEESWIEILESDLWESNSLNDIFPALQISYARLPTHLKLCFLFCSMYPKDYWMPKKNLIELWISQGYVKPTRKRTSREIGTEYYEELRARSFIDVAGSKLCKLHDIMHDLARLNSENEYYSVEINQPHDSQMVHIPQEVYHLYAEGLVECIDKILPQNLKGLRTFCTDLRGLSEIYKHEECLNLAKFEALRVLELRGDDLLYIPDSIVHLKHLSYLRITSRRLNILPISIGFLYNLQTFILDCYESPLKFLPESIGNLANLRYLCINCGYLNKLPKSLALLSNLQRLTIRKKSLDEVTLENNFLHFPIILKQHIPLELPSALGKCCGLEILKISGCSISYNPHGLDNFPALSRMRACLTVRTIGWLKDMKDLEGDLIIEGLENMGNLADAQLSDLRSKCKIKTLILRWYNNHNHNHKNYEDRVELTLRLMKEADEGRQLRQLPEWSFSLLENLQPHSHLKKFVLDGYHSSMLPWWMRDPLSLQTIQEIILKNCDGIKSLPFCNLQSLRYLEIYRCASIQFLQLNQLASQLEVLDIMDCPQLEFIAGLGDLGMLTTLRITCCEALKSVTMDRQQLVESTHDDSPQNTTTSLKELVIWGCFRLCALPPELLQSGLDNVWVFCCGCPDLYFGKPYILHVCR